MAKTIEEVKKLKIGLESAILKLLNDFESETGVNLGYISTERERPSTKDGYHPGCCLPEEAYDGKPYANVDISLRIE